MARRCLTSDATTSGTGVTSPAPHLRPVVKLAVAGNVVVAVLFFVAIVWRLFFSGKVQDDAVVPEGTDGGGVAPASDASSSGASSPCESPRPTGLRKEDLIALPVYVHGALAEEGVGVGGKVECAVCLSELRDGDTARLLPRCGHRFHAECVDRWFRSHATCPLCRAVVADGGSGDPKVQAGV